MNRVPLDCLIQLPWLVLQLEKAGLCCGEPKWQLQYREHGVCVVRVLPIHHSKQEIVFLHPDKSSSRHLLHKGLVLWAHWRKSHTHLQSIHAAGIHYGHVCTILCYTTQCLSMSYVPELQLLYHLQKRLTLSRFWCQLYKFDKICLFPFLVLQYVLYDFILDFTLYLL